MQIDDGLEVGPLLDRQIGWLAPRSKYQKADVAMHGATPIKADASPLPPFETRTACSSRGTSWWL
jgi:hypothetical protein